MKKIAFYYRKGIIAKGDFAQSSCIIHYLHKYFPNQYRFICINFINEEKKEMIVNDDVIFVDSEIDCLDILSDAIIVVPFNQLLFVLNDLKNYPEVELCITFMHPHTIQWFSNQLLAGDDDCKSILKTINAADAYAFMDESNRCTVNRFSNLNFNQQYFPVCNSNNSDSGICGKGTLIGDFSERIQIGWLGRLDEDKIYSLLNVLDNLYYDCDDVKFDFHIIGDGNARSKINIEKFKSKIRVIYCSYLYGEQRDKYLANNIDIAVAMGVSVLDVSALKIPVIIPILSSYRFRENRYAYLFDTSNFDLDWDILSLKQIAHKTYPISKIITDIYSHKLKKDYGEKCYEFSVAFFSPGNASKEFIKSISCSSLTVKQLMSNRAVKKNITAYSVYRLITRKNIESYVLAVSKFKNIKRKIKIKIIKIKQKFLFLC